MVGGLTKSGQVYESNKKEVFEGIHQQLESGKTGGDEALTRLMKASEYKVVDQLTRVPVQISLIGLLLTSDLHREALIKILKEVKVSEGIAVDKLAHVVNEVLALDQISFSPEELGDEGI